MVERRKYPRFRLKIKANYKAVDSKETKPSKIINISAEGICFESQEKFNVGNQVELELDLEDSNKPVNLTGEIRWFEEIKGQDFKKKAFINGVKLIDIDKLDEGRFLKYYCDKIVDKLSYYLKM